MARSAWLGLVAAAGCAVAPTAHADVARHWDKRTVTYRDATPWPATVARAARMWNRLGSVRLVRTRRRAADVIVTAAGRLPEDVGLTIEFSLDDGVLLAPARVRVSRADVARDPLLRFDVIAHELGHALGLEHSRRACSLMHSRALDDCTGEHGGRVRCGPQRADFRKLQARYGGSLRGVHSGLCPARAGA